MKTLKPQPLKESYYAGMEEQLRAMFYDLIFKPIIELLSPYNQQVRAAKKDLKNAVTDPIVAALKSGRVQYTAGVFSGEFSAAISSALRKIGATFNKRTKVYTLPDTKVPVDVKNMAQLYQATAHKLHVELEKRLEEVEAGLSAIVDMKPVDATKTVDKVVQGFDQTVGEAIGRTELSDQSKEKLSQEYSDNMNLWIKKFSVETIQELREQVEANAAAGYRFDHLVSRIQDRYDVSKTKAEFLAQQETALFVSKHRKMRFTDVGIEEYIWRTANDSKVRDDHKKLNGKTFRYDNPPVIDHNTGQRGNPGEGFRCRCVDEPVMPAYLKEEVAA